MVAVIKTGSSIHRILNYNENKVKLGKAVCLWAGNYPIDASRLNLTMKLNRFLKQMELNQNVKRNSVHISLNFDAAEKDMPADKLTAIADSYMEKLGFGKQPYLVYQHLDAGHPHIHLVTTNIEADGRRIDLHHLAIRKSEPARKEIEVAFGLVKAGEKKKQQQTPDQLSAKKVVYGTSETKTAIQNVLDVVLNKYSYTSISELNAVLKLYNVAADPGAEGSRVNQHKGLLFHSTDEKGIPVGVPIKASLFYSRPTLGRLDVKFSKNAIVGQPLKSRIKNAIDRLATGASRVDFRELENSLAKEGIALVKRENKEGFLYGITYVDHKTGGVFNGSDLGKQYSARAMQDRFPLPLTKGKTQTIDDIPAIIRRDTATMLENIAEPGTASAGLLRDIAALLENFSRVEQPSDFLPGQLKRKKKRKRKGPGNNH